MTSNFLVRVRQTFAEVVCDIPTLIVAVAALSASSAFGQSAEEPVRVSAGFAMPFDVNPGRPDSEGGSASCRAWVFR